MNRCYKPVFANSRLSFESHMIDIERERVQTSENFSQKSMQIFTRHDFQGELLFHQLIFLEEHERWCTAQEPSRKTSPSL